MKNGQHILVHVPCCQTLCITKFVTFCFAIPAHDGKNEASCLTNAKSMDKGEEHTIWRNNEVKSTWTVQFYKQVM
jgi:hypothetical protein